MKISVIVPVFNVQAYIEETICSILPLRDMISSELIMIDDGSKDASKKIIERYQKKYPEFIVCESLDHQGVSGARNCGIEKAKGEYILFCDGDDKIVAENIVKMYMTAQEKMLDIVFGQIQEFDDVKSHIYAPTRRLSECDIIKKDNTDILWSFMISGKLYRAALIKENHLSFEPLTYSEDAVFQIQAVSCARRMGGCPHIASKYRKRLFYEGHSVTQQFTLTHWRDFYSAHMKVRDIAEKQLLDQMSKHGRVKYMQALQRKITESIISAFYCAMWNCSDELFDEIVSKLQKELEGLETEHRQKILTMFPELKLWPRIADREYYKENPQISFVISENIKSKEAVWILKSVYAQRFASFNVIAPEKLKKELNDEFLNMKNMIWVQHTASKISKLKKIAGPDNFGKYIMFFDRGTGLYTTTIRNCLKEMSKKNAASIECRRVKAGCPYALPKTLAMRLKNKFIREMYNSSKILKTEILFGEGKVAQSKLCKEYVIEMAGSEFDGNIG